MTDIDTRHFRTALADYATGVAIITALDAKGRPIGLTANSFTSVSLDPPLVLWCIDENSPFFDDFVRTTHYAVHVLKEDAEPLARRFSNDKADKFSDIDCESGVAGLPLLKDCSALLQCEVTNRYTEGDHVILVGRVVSIRIQSARPLVFHAGTYKRLQD